MENRKLRNCLLCLFFCISFSFNTSFSQGLQWNVKRGHFYLVDSCGNKKSNRHFDLADQFYNFMYSTSVRKKGRWGAINRQGILIVPCKYDYVECYTIPYPFNDKEVPSEHHLIICQNLIGDNHYYSVYNLNGDMIFSGNYSCVQNLLNGYLYCTTDNYDLLVSVETKKEIMFDKKYNLMPYSNGKFAIINCDSLPYKYGVVDTTGSIIHPCIYSSYEDIEDFLK